MVGASVSRMETAAAAEWVCTRRRVSMEEWAGASAMGGGRARAGGGGESDAVGSVERVRLSKNGGGCAARKAGGRRARCGAAGSAELMASARPAGLSQRNMGVVRSWLLSADILCACDVTQLL